MKKSKLLNNLIIFFFLLSLLLPNVSYLVMKNKLNNDNVENRDLAEFPQFNLKQWYNYFPELDTYIVDHAAYKYEFTKFYHKLNINLFGSTIGTDVILGKNNWLYLYNEKAYSNYKQFNIPDSNTLEKLSNHVNNLNTLCEKNNIKFFININPNKEQVYPEYMPDSIKISTLDYSPTDIIANYLGKTTSVPVIYTKSALVEAKKSAQVYLKYDTHWNKIGAFLGAQEVLFAVKGDKDKLSDIKYNEVIGFSGDLAKLLNLGNYYNDDSNYIIKGYQNEEIQFTQEEKFDGRLILTTSNADHNETLFMVCDSYNNDMRTYFAKNFKKCIFVRTELISEGNVNILDYSPDILICEAVERLSFTLIDSLIPILTDQLKSNS